MSWILGGIYCGLIWLIFAKLKLVRMSLPIAIVLASAGPSLIIALLFCAQYYHPYTPLAVAIEKIVPVGVQLTQPGRVTEVVAEPNVPLKTGDLLFRIDEEPYQIAVRRSEVALAKAKQDVSLSESTAALAESTLRRSKADLDFANADLDRNRKLRDSNAVSQQELELSQTKYEQATAAQSQAEERLKQAQLSIDVAKASVVDAENALQNATYNLNQTSIKAPADGYVTNVQVRPGLLVSAGSGPVMTFVHAASSSSQRVIVATFPEKNYLRIRPNQYAEVALDGYPGMILTGRVLNTIDVSGAGQLDASGKLPTSLVDGKPTTFAVRIQLDDSELRLPGGAKGQAAIYTEDMQIAGIPVMFLIRAKSWMNYLF